MRLPAHALALALGCGLLAGGVQAELWQWTDADGVVRYTPDADRVPASARGSLLRIEPGMSPPEPAPATQPGPPSVVSAPPDELRFEADPFNAPQPARRIEVSDVPEPTPPAPPEPAALRAPASVSATAAAPPSAPPGPAPAPPRAAPPAPTTTSSARGSSPQPAAPKPTAPPPPLTPEQRSRRAELEALIAHDEELLKDLVSQDAPDLEDSEELRAVARRLPALQAELRALEEGNAQEATGPMAEP